MSSIHVREQNVDGECVPIHEPVMSHVISKDGQRLIDKLLYDTQTVASPVIHHHNCNCNVICTAFSKKKNKKNYYSVCNKQRRHHSVRDVAGKTDVVVDPCALSFVPPVGKSR